MQAIETTATLTEGGQLQLDEPLNIDRQRVRVIVLIPDDNDLKNKSIESTSTSSAQVVDDSIDTIREGIYQGWQDVLSGKTLPISQLWDGIDVECISCQNCLQGESEK